MRRNKDINKEILQKQTIKKTALVFLHLNESFHLRVVKQKT